MTYDHLAEGEQSAGAIVTLLNGGGPMSAMSRPRLIIDCDPGHDDVIAIAVAAAYADVVTITAVAGNAALHHTERNARIACDLFGLDSVAVHAGADRPLVAPARDATHVHGKTGLDGPPTRAASRPSDSQDAVAILVETIRAEEGLWLVPTGPLTNIALAFRVAPDLPGRLAGISLMGGSTTEGNVTPTAEFNIWADPEAAAAVFSHGRETIIQMSGLNLTHQVLADAALVERLRASDSESARFCAELLNYSRGFHVASERDPNAGCPLHDPCAVLAVTHPELFGFLRRHVAVELTGTHTRGMTVVDNRARADPKTGDIDVAFTVDADAALALIEAAIVRV